MLQPENLSEVKIKKIIDGYETDSSIISVYRRDLKGCFKLT